MYHISFSHVAPCLLYNTHIALLIVPKMSEGLGLGGQPMTFNYEGAIVVIITFKIVTVAAGFQIYNLGFFFTSIWVM